MNKKSNYTKYNNNGFEDPIDILIDILQLLHFENELQKNDPELKGGYSSHFSFDGGNLCFIAHQDYVCQYHHLFRVQLKSSQAIPACYSCRKDLPQNI